MRLNYETSLHTHKSTTYTESLLLPIVFRNGFHGRPSLLQQVNAPDPPPKVAALKLTLKDFSKKENAWESETATSTPCTYTISACEHSESHGLGY